MAEAHGNDHGKGHDHSDGHGPSKPLGMADVIIGTVLFVVFALLLKHLLDAVVPGLLKDQTLWQIIISGLIFLGVWGLLGNSLFVPYLNVLSEREERTVGYEKAAQDKLKDAKALGEKIESELRTARLEGIRKRDSLVDEAKARANKVIEQAEGAADAELKQAKAQIDQLKVKARQELSQEADKLAALVVSRALESTPKPLVH